MAKKKSELVLDLPVAFGNVNFGDSTVRIGITVDRGSLSIDDADINLCERRLTGTIVARPPGDVEGQKTFAGMEGESELSAVFDVKGIAFTADHIKIGLTFALKGLDANTLASFAKKAGRLMIGEVGEIPEKEAKGGDDDPDDDDGED